MKEGLLLNSFGSIYIMMALCDCNFARGWVLLLFA